MKKVLILGSTGSIGRQTLDIIRNQNKRFKVAGLSCNSNIKLFEEQIREFKPGLIHINSDIDRKLKSQLGYKKIYSGEDGLLELIREVDCDIVVLAIVGAAGLKPAIEAIRSGKNIALATKEVMVLAGNLIKQEIKKINTILRKKGKPIVKLFPIDSEHSAIWQSLRSGQRKELEKIILTCSGGPFRSKSVEELNKITVTDALNHPTWNMGRRITIDSATLMNKSLEVIEAKYLFDLNASQIEVVVHPESILHSAVMFRDGSMIGQLSLPDMRIPIQYALSYPARFKTSFERLSLTRLKTLTFYSPDIKKFPCLQYGFEAAEKGGTLPAVINAADEIVVESFLKEKIRFNDIQEIIKKTMDTHKNIINPSLDDIIRTDTQTRVTARMISDKFSTKY